MPSILNLDPSVHVKEYTFITYYLLLISHRDGLNTSMMTLGYVPTHTEYSVLVGELGRCH